MRSSPLIPVSEVLRPNGSQPFPTARHSALLDDEPDVVRPATCPMCHTRASLTQSALDAGGAWRCVRCGQHWDAARLAAGAGYAAWVVQRDRADRRGRCIRQGGRGAIAFRLLCQMAQREFVSTCILRSESGLTSYLGLRVRQAGGMQ